jgi:hypothetical protein
VNGRSATSVCAWALKLESEKRVIMTSRGYHVEGTSMGSRAPPRCWRPSGGSGKFERATQSIDTARGVVSF